MSTNVRFSTNDSFEPIHFVEKLVCQTLNMRDSLSELINSVIQNTSEHKRA